MASSSASSIPFSAVDDKDLDDAELWAVIDSAAASHSISRSRKSLSSKKSFLQNSVPIPKYSVDDDAIASPDGEVLQEQSTYRRPQKISRMDPGFGDDGRIIVFKHQQQTPPTPPPSYLSLPGSGRFSMQHTSPVIETSPNGLRQSDERQAMGHSLSGRFPSVSLFKQYQNAAMAILEKTDYTMIHGNPFIKKSGWRKISFFFNLSFEIKDKSIEYDDNRNVLRAEFVVRAYMQGGRFSDGWGSCERREKRFNKPNHDIPSTAETRAKNKACQDLLGIGEYRPGASNAHR